MKKLFAHREYHFDFIKWRKIGYAVSATLLIAAFALFFTKGLNYGIDFQGGILMEVRSEKIDIAKVRSDLSFLKDLSIQSIGQNNDGLLIQTKGDGTEANGNQVAEKIKTVLGSAYTYERVEVIGPRIGDELKQKSLMASVLALLAISIYIWFRFEWPFAVGCLVALAWNLIVTVGIFALFQIPFDMIIVAGLLTIAGYDCNDTIVTYDRIRDCLKKYRKMPTDDLLNKGINETLSRTILTCGTTIVVSLILVFFGGDTLRGFAIAMTIGVTLGSFSSWAVSVPLLRYFDIRNLGIKGTNVAGPYAAAAAFEYEAKKEPLPPYSKCGGKCN